MQTTHTISLAIGSKYCRATVVTVIWCQIAKERRKAIRDRETEIHNVGFAVIANTTMIGFVLLPFLYALRDRSIVQSP
jgi:hypothetical protein